MTNGKMGLACDRDGYDLRIRLCPGCGSRGCSNGFRCEVPKRQPRTPRYGWAIPNRLYGAQFNDEGDVV